MIFKKVLASITSLAYMCVFLGAGAANASEYSSRDISEEVIAEYSLIQKMSMQERSSYLESRLSSLIKKEEDRLVIEKIVFNQTLPELVVHNENELALATEKGKLVFDLSSVSNDRIRVGNIKLDFSKQQSMSDIQALVASVQEGFQFQKQKQDRLGSLLESMINNVLPSAHALNWGLIAVISLSVIAIIAVVKNHKNKKAKEEAEEKVANLERQKEEHYLLEHSDNNEGESQPIHLNDDGGNSHTPIGTETVTAL